VKYTFTPADDLDLVLGEDNDLKNSLTNSAMVYSESSENLGLSCLDSVSTPKKADLEKRCNLKEGQIVFCEVRVLASGSCTPLVFRFTGL